MEPNNPQAERLLSYTDTCRRAAQGLYWLLREVERNPERAAELATLRHLFGTPTAPDPEAVEVIDQHHHRAHLHPVHPMALPEGDPRRTQPLVAVGAFDPLAHMRTVLAEPQTEPMPSGWTRDPHAPYGIERHGIVDERISYARGMSGDPILLLAGDGVEVRGGGVALTVRADLVQHVIREGARLEANGRG